MVITGAAGGVGYAYAGEFLDRGYDVVLCDVRDCGSALASLESRAAATGARAYSTKCDVTDSESVEALGRFARDKLGTVGYWINNAGINGGRRALADVPMSQVELVVKVNLLGILFGTKVAMEIMSDQVRGRSHPRCVCVWGGGVACVFGHVGRRSPSFRILLRTHRQISGEKKKKKMNGGRDFLIHIREI